MSQSWYHPVPLYKYFTDPAALCPGLFAHVAPWAKGSCHLVGIIQEFPVLNEGSRDKQFRRRRSKTNTGMEDQ